MPMISSVYSKKRFSDEDLTRTPTHITERQSSNNNSDLLINKKMSKIIFKIKKHYIIYI